ncbi:MAG: polymerase subunit delta [Xanthobacteraceae bacterium]|nr:polymerase subunit delta [Xanthobacteraceae bacterium]
MVAVKTSDIDAFVARPNPAQPVILLFGPDAGLVRERAEALIASAVDDIKDPFALARLESEDLSENPSRLVEEANTIPLFGGRRAVWVRAGGRNIAPAVEALLGATSPDCRVVIEAGDLKKNAPLRTLCERAKNAAALACYADGERDVARLIDQEVRDAGLSIADDARTALVAILGGDRQSTRSELRKLLLYAHGQSRIELDDISAVVADAAALGLDGVIDAAFAGKPSELETQFARARNSGTAAGTILLAAQRQVALLHKTMLNVDQGRSPSQAVESMMPPVHFRRKTAVEAALRVWTSRRLDRVMQDLGAATLESRRQPSLADAIAQRALLSIAVNARRRE